MSVERLALGMFVVELDRPWLDTPFLIQGFLVDSAIELSTLRKYCRHVFVDLEMSNPDVVKFLRDQREYDEFEEDRAVAAASPPRSPAAPARKLAQRRPAAAQPGDAEADEVEPNGQEPDEVPAPPARVNARVAEGTPPRRGERAYRIRADVKISSDTRERFRQLVRGTPPLRQAGSDESLGQRALSRLKGLLGGSRNENGLRPDETRLAAEFEAEITAALGPDAQLQTYVERRAVADEIPRARTALARGEEILANVIADVRNHRIPQVEQVEAAVDDMVESMIDNPDALLWVAQLREEHSQTYQHGVRVALYMIALGRQLGFPKAELGHLGMVGMLADVGKIRLPRALLEKPGMLNPAEYSIVKEHVRLGLEMLTQDVALPPEVEVGIAQHHERLDGSGYPKGLKGAEISLHGQLAAIADSFAALITPRAYANPLAPQDALMNLYQWAGTSFRAPLVEQFVQAVGVFPVGSLVELSSGEVAVVLAHNRVRRLEPRVLVLSWPDKRPLPIPLERNLLVQMRESGKKQVRIVKGLPSGAYGLRLRDYYADELANANRLV